MRLLLVLSFAVVPLSMSGCKGDPSTPEFWAKALKGAHKSKERVRVLDDLRSGKHATPAFLPLLHKQLAEDKSADVKTEIARLLGELADPSSVAPLTDAIDWGNTESSANRMNKEITNSLGRINDPATRDTLLKLLTRAKDPYVRIEAINALGAQKVGAAVEPLISIATDETGEPFISKKAIQALGEIGDPKAVQALTKMMFKERKGVSFYMESSYALFQIGPAAASYLVPIMNDQDKAFKGWIQDNGIKEAAIYAKLAQVLGDLNERAAEKPLLSQLKFDSQFLDLKLFVRMKAADALGRFRSKEAQKLLVDMLDEEEATARQEYIRALVNIGGREAIPGLVKAASKGSWDAREPALIGFTLLGDERELPAVEKMVKDEEALTTAECKDNEDYAGCKELPALVKKHTEAITKHAKRLEAGKQCKNDAACWVKKLDDPDSGVRERAGLEVGRSGDGQWVGALLAHLGEPDLNARFAIIQGTGWLVLDSKAAAQTAMGSLPAIEKQIADEKAKTEFVKVNEDLRRLAVRVKRQGS